jgi:nitrogen fixation NifU-like protein
MTDSLIKLYNELILERQKDPAGFEKRDDAQVIIKAYNPVCGDKFNLYLDLEGDSVVRASYYGYGCALSKASTSLLIQTLSGTRIPDLMVKIDDFYKKLGEDLQHSDQLIKALAMARNFPGRDQCARLSWDALGNYLKTTY